MMNVLWLHGMGGSPSKEKIAIMEEYGLSVYALHMDYTKEPDRFTILQNYILENNINLLIGSSFGGFLAFWLSEQLAIPCILLNPAVSLRGKHKTKPSEVTLLKSPLTIVAVGENDEQVDAERTLLFMEKDKREDKNIYTKLLLNEGHGFSEQAFRNILDWALPLVKEYIS